MPEVLGRLRTPRLAAAPSSPQQGEMYFDTITNTLFYWDGTTWQSASRGPTGYETAPIGSVLAWTSQSTLPDGWLLMNGQTVTEAAYPDLTAFAATEVGLGNTLWTQTGTAPNRITTIPDLRDRFIYGGGGASPTKAMGSKAGAETHTMSVAEMPAHAHSISDPGHGHSSTGSRDTAGGYTITILAGGGFSHPTSASGTGIGIYNTGGGGAHNNMPPYCVLAYMIKAKGIQQAGSTLVGPKGDKGDAADPIPLDTWHLPGTGTEPAFANSFKSYGYNGNPSTSYESSPGSFTGLGFRKDQNGRVYFKGFALASVALGAGAQIFVLPVGYRPPKQILWDSNLGGATAARIDVQPSGSINVSPAMGANQWIVLDGLSFDTESVTNIAVGPRGPAGVSGTDAYSLPTCRLATTADISLTSAPAQIDGVSPTVGDVILVWLQANKVANGLYVWNGASQAMTRLASVTTGQALAGGVRVYVRDGVLYDNQHFYLRADGTVGTNNLVFSPPYGSIIADYLQEGENNAYVGVGNGSNITVNAAQNKLLAWVYTPPVDVAVELYFQLGLVQKTDAAYHYGMIAPICSPAPVRGSSGGSALYKMQHSQVQTYDFYELTKRYDLAAGTQYTMYINFGCSGGTWQYHQANTNEWMLGKAWIR